MLKLKNIIFSNRSCEWKQLSNELNGKFIKGKYWHSDQILARRKKWAIRLDTYILPYYLHCIKYTRMIAPFLNKENFYFTIYNRNIFGEIEKLCGMKHFKPCFSDFASKFIIKGNDENKLSLLLENQKIRQLIQAQPSIYLSIKDNVDCLDKTFPEDISFLYFHVPSMVKNTEQIKLLYDLFEETMNQLNLMGIAEEHENSFMQ